MSQSLANIVVHLVFSTKGRRQLLRDEERGQLHAYITGILKNHDSPVIEINSGRDPIHLGLHPRLSHGRAFNPRTRGARCAHSPSNSLLQLGPVP